MLFMSGLPCGDAEACGENEQATTLAVAHGSNHEEEPEDCTPFCVCSCCAASGMNWMSCLQIVITPKVKKSTFLFPSPFFESYTVHAVWQPPRSRSHTNSI